MPPPITANLLLRLDASSLTGLSDGDPVTGWDDDSGNGHHFDSRGNCTYRTNQFVDLPAVEFLDTTNPGIIYRPDTSGMPVPGSSSLTMFVVFRPTAWQGTNPGLWRSGANASGNNFMIFSGSTGRPWIRWASSDVLNPASGYGVPLNENILTTWRLESAASAEFYADGVLQHNATHSASAAAFNIRYFGFQNDSGQRVPGMYGEILIYDAALSTADREAVENHLIAKWLTEPVILNADPGTYTVTGSAAQTIRDIIMGADPGAYTYTGSAADTFGQIILDADPGSYDVTGFNADTLLSALVMGADSGAYAITGAASDTFTTAAPDPPPDPSPGGLLFGYWDTATSSWVEVSGTSVQPIPRPAPALRRRFSGRISTTATVAGAVLSADRPRGWTVRSGWHTELEADDLRATLLAPGFLTWGGTLVGDDTEARAVRVRRVTGPLEDLATIEFQLLARSP